MTPLSADFGTVSSWVAVGASLFAFAVSALTFVMNERRTRRAERQVQAAKVSAWYSDSAGGSGSGMYVLNASDAPVYAVVVAKEAGDGYAHSYDTRKLYKAKEPPEYAVLSVVPPGLWSVTLDRGSGGAGAMGMRYHAAISFTDNAGLHWHRNGVGHLRKASKSAFDWFEVYRPLQLSPMERAAER